MPDLSWLTSPHTGWRVPTTSINSYGGSGESMQCFTASPTLPRSNCLCGGFRGACVDFQLECKSSSSHRGVRVKIEKAECRIV